MIRLIQRKLIIPRGDTGTFSVPVLSTSNTGDVAVFTIFDTLTRSKVYQKQVEATDSVLTIRFEHEDTVNLPAGKFVWDIKFYQNPVFIDGELVSGNEVDSYYAAYSLPECEIRMTGDNLLTSDEAPTSTVSPMYLNIVNAAINDANAAKRDATTAKNSAEAAAGQAADILSQITGLSAEATSLQPTQSATANYNAETGVLTIGIPKGVSITSITKTNTSGLIDTYTITYSNNTTTTFTVTNGATPVFSIGTVTEGATAAATITGTTANPVLNLVLPVGSIPTKVSQLQNDSGFITAETDPTVPEWAKAAQKPTYTAEEVGAYVKPVNGISASDLAAGVIPDISGKQDILTFDSAPTQNSNNPVTSGGIYTALSNINSMNVHICITGEYNTETGIPTIQNPDGSTFYLVPGGTSPNLYVEWVYVNNTWEQFGQATLDLSGYQTKITASGLLKGNGSGGVSAATAGTDYGTYSKPSGGIPSTDMTEAVQTSLGKADTALQSAPVADVQVNGTSIVNNNVANVPLAGTTDAGVVKVASGNGIKMTDGALQIDPPNITQIKNATNYYLPITPAYQHAATFYGLAAASGDSTQRVSENVVGEYTDSAKFSIQSMLDTPSQAAIASKETATATAAHAIGALFLMGGKLYRATAAIAIGDAIVTSGAGANAEQTSVAEEIPTVPVTDVQVNGISVLSNGVANVPIASSTDYGVSKVDYTLGIGMLSGFLSVSGASDNEIKTASTTRRPIQPVSQHKATFYGLAKAAGDTSQSSSSNAVGTYTEDAKSAISTMLNGAVSVSGSTPSITAKAGIRYICGEVATLDITLPASGIVDVVFESGSTATVLTITPPTGVTLKWANGFDPSSLEANTTYEINIADGLGVAASWT